MNITQQTENRREARMLRGLGGGFASDVRDPRGIVAGRERQSTFVLFPTGWVTLTLFGAS
jgi:hypothetical protein